MIYLYLFIIAIGILLLVFNRKRVRNVSDEIHPFKAMNDTNRIAKNIRLEKIYFVLRGICQETIGTEKKERLKSILMISFGVAVITFVNYYYSILSFLMAFPVSIFFTTYIYYIHNKKQRKTQFDVQFLEALNIINSVISSGNSILQAIETCGRKIDGIVGREFKAISQKLSYGEEPKSAFMQSYAKMPYREYYFFIAIVLNNLNTGGQLKKAMSNIIGSITNSRITEKKKIAKTAEVRTSIKVLSAIPCLFLWFLKNQNPEGFRILTEDPVGQIFFYYSISSVLIGIVILWSMMNKI